MKKKFENKLLYGDCLDILPRIKSGAVDMGLFDLPFGITRNEWDLVIPTEKLFPELKRVIKDSGAHLHFATQPFDKQLGYVGGKIIPYKYDWIWEKNKGTGHLNAKIAPMRAHENILVFYQKRPVYHPQAANVVGSYDGFTFGGHEPMHAVRASKKKVARGCYNETVVSGNPGGSTDRMPRTVLRFPVINNDDTEKWHKTQKPVELLEYLIKTYTNEGDLILDCTSGSGSVGIACLNTGRKFLLIEKNLVFYRKSRARIRAHAKQMGIEFGDDFNELD